MKKKHTKIGKGGEHITFKEINRWKRGNGKSGGKGKEYRGKFSKKITAENNLKGVKKGTDQEYKNGKQNTEERNRTARETKSG